MESTNSKMSNEEIKAKSVEILRWMGVSDELIREYEQHNFIPDFNYGFKTSGWHKSRLNHIQGYSNVPYEPYAITLDEVHGMKMINFLFVSPYREDFDFMFRYIGFKDMFSVYAYCYNVDCPYLSESGSILVEIKNGCIKRIG